MNYTFLPDEKKVFETIIKSNGISLLDISKQTKLHRPTVYKIIDKLLKEQLVTTKKSEGKVTKENESKRLVYIKGSRSALEKKLTGSKQELQNLLHEEEAFGKNLLDSYFSNNAIRKIEGKEAITEFYETLAERLPQQQCYYSLGTTTKMELLDKVLSKKFRTLREKKNLWSYVVATQPPLKQPRFSLAIKQLSISPIPPHCSWVSYSDVFAFLNFEKEYGYVITDKTLAEFQQAIIKAMYEKIA